MAVRKVNDDACAAINRMVGLEGIPVKQIAGDTGLSGGGYYPAPCELWAGEDTWGNPVLNGKRQFCVSSAAKTENYFISIIIAR